MVSLDSSGVDDHLHQGHVGGARDVGQEDVLSTDRCHAGGEDGRHRSVGPPGLEPLAGSPDTPLEPAGHHTRGFRACLPHAIQDDEGDSLSGSCEAGVQAAEAARDGREDDGSHVLSGCIWKSKR